MFVDRLTLPRTPLAQLPTPLEPLDRLSESLGGPRIWMKRDDCTGLATGGNKTRKLEFLLGAALARGADTVITFGAVQSNHARQTAAACAAKGLRCHLLLARKVPWSDPGYERLGNVLLDRLLGAHVHLTDADDIRSERDRLLARFENEGRRVDVIPVGGSNGTGALGYALCAEELKSQCDALGIPLTHVFHATSSAGTQGGLLAGFRMLGLLEGKAPVLVHGINVSEPPAEEEALRTSIRTLAESALSLAALGPTDIEPAHVRVDGRWLGEGYGLPTEGTLEAIRLVAGLEGVLLDPVYSGKAMSGLIGCIRSGELDGVPDVVFIHTGGVAALPVYADVLVEEAQSNPS